MSRSFDDRLDDVLRAIERIRMAGGQLTSRHFLDKIHAALA